MQEQLLAATERERDLERKLLQAQLRLEQHAEHMAATAAAVVPAAAGQSGHSSNNRAGSKVDAAGQQQQPVDAATAAVIQAQQQLLQAKDAELQLLRQQQATAESKAEAGAAATAGAQQPVPQQVSHGSSAAGTTSQPAAAVGGDGSRVPLLALGSLNTPPVSSTEPPGLSLEPELLSGLTSPLGQLPSSPGSGASFWLGPIRGFTEQGAVAAAAGDATALHPGSTAAAATAGSKAGDSSRRKVERDARGEGAEDLADLELLPSARSTRTRGFATFAGRPLSASADAALGTSSSPAAAAGSQAAASGVAALAAQVLKGQRWSNVSSLRSSLEEANLVLLGHSSLTSPHRQPQPSSHRYASTQGQWAAGRRSMELDGHSLLCFTGLPRSLVMSSGAVMQKPCVLSCGQ